MRKAIIIGGGAAGIFTALSLFENCKDVSIEIIEKELKLGKKLRATGNGHANILNRELNLSSYNHKNLKFCSILSNFSFDDLLEQYERWNVPTMFIGNLGYPLVYHAPSFVNHLEGLLVKKNIKITLGATVFGYHHVNNKIVLDTSVGTKTCDKLIITSGGSSSPKLGSDGSLFELLRGKGYLISDLFPGLAPIKTKEKISKALVGLRHKASISLKDGNGPTIYRENGEYLYKKDGLSGICIMNISSIIKWNNLKKPVIHIDLFPNQDVSNFVSESNENEAVLEYSFYQEVLDQAKKRNISFNEAVHDLNYSYSSDFTFEDSQATIGGIEESCVNEDLSSSIENNIYFAGEILDFDGLCGGFNLMWALISALTVSRSLRAS